MKNQMYTVYYVSKTKVSHNLKRDNLLGPFNIEQWIYRYTVDNTGVML